MRKITIGILAHVDAGKTTLSEALLYTAGAIKKMGRVDKGDAFLDTDIKEKERGITIYSKNARFSYKDVDFCLIDTPGHVDFSAEMERALSVLDLAVLLVSASEPIQAHTNTLSQILKRQRIPTFIFVNKMDLPGGDKKKILKELEGKISSYVTDFSLEGEDFFEGIASQSEELMDIYLDKGRIEDDLIKRYVKERKLLPCFFGSALRLEEIDKFLEALVKFSDMREEKDEFSALVYKISYDPKGVRLTHLKLLGGRLKIKEFLGEEKVNEIRLYNAGTYENKEEVTLGEIFTVPGLEKSRPRMCYGKDTFVYKPSLEPVIRYAVKLEGKDNTESLSIIKTLEDEEPGLKAEYDEESKEIRVSLMGEVEKEILQRRIYDDYKVKASFSQGKISYLETIKKPVEGVGHFEPLRHYAEVHLKLEPLNRGEGLVFESLVNEDDLKLNWQRLILTHLKEKTHRGVLTGSPITDMKITLVAGKAHLKHTEGGDFRQATYRAVRQGLMEAESLLLEPFYNFTLSIPDDLVGKAMTDLDFINASFSIQESFNGITVINGRGPAVTLNEYAGKVREYTRGKGQISLIPAGYEVCHNTEEVLENTGYDPEKDIKNTPDSVFCYQGAGTVVSWKEVPNHMHLPFVTYEGENEKIKPQIINHAKEKEKEIFVSSEEIDKIINSLSNSNKKENSFSYKGKSGALRDKQRSGIKKTESQLAEYKGTKEKENFLLIDGYNVVHAWPELRELASENINAAAGRLMDIVSNYQAISGYKTILVFDAYKVKGHSEEVLDYHNIKVVYTKTAETADHYIERYAHEKGKKYPVTVVTSDGVEQVIIRGAGAWLISSRDFLNLVNDLNEELRNKNGIKNAD